MRKEFGVSNRNGDSWRFQPKVEEAPSNEGAFLVPTTPHIGKPRGWGTLRARDPCLQYQPSVVPGTNSGNVHGLFTAIRLGRLGSAPRESGPTA